MLVPSLAENFLAAAVAPIFAAALPICARRSGEYTLILLAFLWCFGRWALCDCTSSFTSQFAEAIARGGIELERLPFRFGRVLVFLL